MPACGVFVPGCDKLAGARDACRGGNPGTMSSFAWQVVGMVLLVGTVWAGYRFWRHGLAHEPSRAEVLAALVLLGTLAGGFWGAFAWWQNLAYAFSWSLPGLAARMLAAAGWSFALAAAFALGSSSIRHLRLVLLMLWVYLAPLTLAILTLHLERFDFTRDVTVAFFAIVVLLLVSSSIALFALPRNDPVSDALPRAPARLALWTIGAVAGCWAIALFVKPDGPSPLIWTWPRDALTTRLIASMFLATSVGAFAALPGRRLGRTVFWVTIAYALGIMVAGFAHAVWADPVLVLKVEKLPASYMVVWGVLGAIAAMALLVSGASETEQPEKA
ncbi:MAG: hypothetical protein LJE67_01895 [Salaquimonas sp.]|nr:hypothetical protein [Salaquimonas sp.]